MIVLKTKSELSLMRIAGKISAQALRIAGEMVRPGVTTAQIDREVGKFILSKGATPSFLGYGGFPANICISLNDTVIHGIPSGRVIKEGDIVSIDVGAFYKGYHGDNAATFPAGKVSLAAQALMDATAQSLYKGIDQARVGGRVGDISSAVQQYVESFGYSAVRKYVGHGVGKEMHESPEVPNFGRKGSGPRLAAGMTLAIEPMINQGGHDVKVLSDGWTVLTADGMLSAHFEQTVLITESGPIILTEL